MFGSNVLDIAFGLVFSFLAISLVASTATEAVSSAMSWRANTLLQGVKSLLNDQNFTGLAKDIYNHGLVNGLSDGNAAAGAEPPTKPSYIDPKLFASALTDVKDLDFATNFAGLKASIAKVTDPQLRGILDAIADRTKGDIDKFHAEVASWFDRGMDRVAGIYKRRTQLWNFWIALALAVALNVDIVSIAEALWNQPLILKGVTLDASKDVNPALKTLNDHFPVGWGKTPDGPLGWIAAVLGWFIAGVATLFGAPFWFDALKNIANLRGTGASPSEKKATS